MKKICWFFLGCLLLPCMAHAQVPSTTSPNSVEENISDAGINEELELSADSEHSKEIEALIQILVQPNQPKAVLAAERLNRIVRSADLRLLIDQLQTCEITSARVAIIEAIQSLRDRRSAKSLVFELENGSGDSQVAAARALGQLNSEWPIPSLYRILIYSSNVELQKAASAALATIGGARAVYALQTAKPNLKDEAGRAVYWSWLKASGQLDDRVTDSEIAVGQKKRLYAYKGMRYYFYAPAYRKKAKPYLMVCIHGADLRFEETYDSCIETAEKYQTALLVPIFDHIRFQDYYYFGLNTGVPHERADKWFLELVDFVAKKADLDAHEMFIYGKDAGGAFVQRFAMSYPDRIARAVMWTPLVVELNESSMFPWGFGTHPLAPDLKPTMYSFLKTDLAVISHSQDSRDTKRNVRLLYDRVHELSANQGILPRLRFFYLVLGRSPELTIFDYLFPQDYFDVNFNK